MTISIISPGTARLAVGMETVASAGQETSITHIALRILSGLGLALSVALFLADMSSWGQVTLFSSVGLWCLNELLFAPERPFELYQEVIMPSEGSIPDFPEILPTRVGHMAGLPVRQGEILPGNPLEMPDPGARLEGTGVDPRHFIESLEELRNAPQAPSNITLSHVKCLFPFINFTNANAPCCVFAGMRDFHNSYGQSQMHSGYERYRTSSQIDLNQFIFDLDCVVERVNDLDGNTQQLFKYIVYKYLKVEQNLIDPNNSSYIPNGDPRIVEGSPAFDAELKRLRDSQIAEVNARNQGIDQLMNGLDGCPNRMRMEIYEVYRKVIGQAPTDLESDVKERLKDLRFNILGIIANNRRNDLYLPEISQSVQYLLGPTRGVTEHIYMSTYPHRPYSSRVDEETAYCEFNEAYNRRTLVETVRQWLNGVGFIPERGRGVSEIEFSRIHDWFKNHVPEGRNRDDFLSEDVYENFTENDFRIKEGAVAYFLKKIGVITEGPPDACYERRP